MIWERVIGRQRSTGAEDRVLLETLKSNQGAQPGKPGNERILVTWVTLLPGKNHALVKPLQARMMELVISKANCLSKQAKTRLQFVYKTRAG